MEQQKLREEVHELISNNRTEEAFELLSKTPFTKENKALAILSSQYSRIKEEQRLNVISADDAEIRINKVNSALIDFSSTLESENKSSLSGLIPKQGRKFNPMYLLLLLLPIAGYFLYLNTDKNTSAEKMDNTTVDTTDTTAAPVAPIISCEETSFSTKVIYKVESPVGYLTLSSEALSVAQEKAYLHKNNPKAIAKLDNGILVSVIDDSLPRYLKVKVESRGNNENKTGYVPKCKDGAIPLSAFDRAF
jgi:hypothetical protein